MHAARNAIQVNPRSVKALYRAARGFLALDRVDDADGCCELALELDPSNVEIVRMRERVQERAKQLQKRQTEREERQRRDTLEQEALKVAFVVRLSVMLTTRLVDFGSRTATIHQTIRHPRTLIHRSVPRTPGLISL